MYIHLKKKRSHRPLADIRKILCETFSSDGILYECCNGLENLIGIHAAKCHLGERI